GCFRAVAAGVPAGPLYRNPMAGTKAGRYESTAGPVLKRSLKLRIIMILGGHEAIRLAEVAKRAIHYHLYALTSRGHAGCNHPPEMGHRLGTPDTGIEHD